MTKHMDGTLLAEILKDKFPGVVKEATEREVVIDKSKLTAVCGFLRQDKRLKFDFLVHLTAVDRIHYFELVYRLASLSHNHGAVLKVYSFDRDEPTVPSVVSVWRGADFQEREVYDLMGVSFDGHPNMKRILTWEGFVGHPLRKDYLQQRP